jgi:hypothetical protein
MICTLQYIVVNKANLHKTATESNKELLKF